MNNICEFYKHQLSETRKKYCDIISEISQSQMNRYVQATCALEDSCLPQVVVNRILKGLPVEGFQQKDILLVQTEGN